MVTHKEANKNDDFMGGWDKAIKNMPMKEEQMITCPKCHGKGVYDVAVYNQSGEMCGWNPTVCNLCGGVGKVTLQFYEELQRKCRGK